VSGQREKVFKEGMKPCYGIKAEGKGLQRGNEALLRSQGREKRSSKRE